MRTGIAARVNLRDQPIQQLALPDHSELLARGPLLRGRVRFERVRQAPQRIQPFLQIPDGLSLFDDLAPQLKPVEGAVFPCLKGEPREGSGGEDPDEARPRHNPYRWRPG